MAAAARIGVFHPGTQHSWQTARALQDTGQLAWYATSIFYDPKRWPYVIEKMLPGALRQRVHHEFSRFHHPALSPQLVRSGGWNEWLFRLANRAGARRLARHLNRRSNTAFGRSVSKLLQNEPVDALWGYDDASLEAFASARGAGTPCILDVTIGDPRAYARIMEAVYDSYAEFFPGSRTLVPQELIDRKDAEYDLAEVILAGSDFCADTITGVRPDLRKRVRRLEYCYDDLFFADAPPRGERRPDEPVRFLFLGQAGPRKGIHLVLNVFQRIPESAASLTIVGELQVPRPVFARYADRVTWIPTVPRAEVLAYYARSDCLLFPSYFEGAAISLFEALAAGIGIIQSRNNIIAVTEDTGLVLPELSEDALYEAVMTVIDDRRRLDHWSHHARAAAASHTYGGYRDRVGALVADVTGRRPSTSATIATPFVP